MNEDTTLVQEISSLALQATQPKHLVEGGPFVVLAPEQTIASLEDLQDHPNRQKGFARALAVQAFIDLTNRNKTPETLVYVDSNIAKPSLKTVFNGQAPGPDARPGWGDHGVIYTCPFSVEWLRWSAMDGKRVSQTEFAQFIEDNLMDIVDPSGADMLEISRTLEAKKSVNFASGVRLSNGQNELTYEEKIEGTASKGKLKIPEVFSIGIPVFVDGQAYKVEARLRYRIGQAGSMTIGYDLVRPHKVVEDALKGIVQGVAAATQMTPLMAIPV